MKIKEHLANEKKQKQGAEFKEKELAHYKGLADELSEQIALSQGAEKEYEKVMHMKALEVDAKQSEIKAYKQEILEKQKEIEMQNK